MERKMFGHRFKKRSDNGRVPGEPYNTMDDDNEDSYTYVKSKDNLQKGGKRTGGREKGNPPGYEGKEHVKYKDPGYSSHHIRFPEDEPHMKSKVSRNEMHEMEDNFHKETPDQTEYSLEAKIKRARMKMDDPKYNENDRIKGNPVHQVAAEGEVDSTGEEEMGPNDMQSGKEQRKKMIVAVMKRKMKK